MIHHAVSDRELQAVAPLLFERHDELLIAALAGQGPVQGVALLRDVPAVILPVEHEPDIIAGILLRGGGHHEQEIVIFVGIIALSRPAEVASQDRIHGGAAAEKTDERYEAEQT